MKKELIKVMYVQPLEDYMIMSTGVFLTKDRINKHAEDPEFIYKDRYKNISIYPKISIIDEKNFY